MTIRDDLRRARRTFWTLLVATTAAGGWLWAQATGASLVSGRWLPAVNVAAALIGAMGLLLLLRIVWRLSSRDEPRGER